ncbi:MAG: PLP-dependent aspartate aminotransferase family protein [Proteobacteria bacterium]|jgi:cystathionine gamma-lyase|nr:PLP-dependent aspartate aminotransferase family protein [Pseudomonadota bacterium]
MDWKFATRAIRIGSEPEKTTGATIPPVYLTSTYTQSVPGEPIDGYDYARCKNPTRDAFARCIASLENAKYGIATTSGLAAVNIIMQSLPAKSNIIVVDDIYGGAYRQFTTVLNEYHNYHFCDTTNLENLKNVCEKLGKVALIWLETPTNPLLKVTDIKAAVEIAKKYGALTVVDNTFLTPYLQNPINHGVDIIMHSATKYINGHTDLLAGIIATNNEELHNKMMHVQKTVGNGLSPFDSWLALRGVKTLEVRMQKHQENAQKVAEYLRNHKKIQKVIYPGFSDFKGHEIMKKNCNGNFMGGGMISFYIDTNFNGAAKFLGNLKVIQLAESLGGIESLVCIPARMTHASVPKELREKNGITDTLIRLSVGIENVEDLILDIETALKFC